MFLRSVPNWEIVEHLPDIGELWIIKPSKHGSTKHEKKNKEINYNKLFMFNENDMLFLQYAVIQTCI